MRVKVFPPRPQPESVTLSAQEGEAMIERLVAYALSVADCQILIKVVRWHFCLVFALQESKLSLKRLRTLLFGTNPPPSTPSVSVELSPAPPPVGEGEGGEAVPPMDEEVTGFAAAGAAVEPGELDTEAMAKPTGGHRLGTGRLGAAAYEGAKHVVCRHAELAVGQRCPVCGQGTLYELPPGSEIRIDGHALLSALCYEFQKLRCSACGQIFTAPLPDEAGTEKYSARARAVLALGRYSLGLPFYRLQDYRL